MFRYDGTAESWNRCFPVGMPVLALGNSVSIGGLKLVTRTTCPAWTADNGQAVVSISTDSGQGVERVTLDDLEIDHDLVAAASYLSFKRHGMARGRVELGHEEAMRLAATLAPLAAKAVRTVQRLGFDLVGSHMNDGLTSEEAADVLRVAVALEAMVASPLASPKWQGPVGRVFMDGLVPGGLYVTRVPSGDKTWVFVSAVGFNVTMESEGKRSVVHGADLGLCPYGVGGTAGNSWHPSAITESLGVRVGDGAVAASRIDAEADGVEIEETEE